VHLHNQNTQETEVPGESTDGSSDNTPDDTIVTSVEQSGDFKDSRAHDTQSDTQAKNRSFTRFIPATLGLAAVVILGYLASAGKLGFMDFSERDPASSPIAVADQVPSDQPISNNQQAVPNNDTVSNTRITIDRLLKEAQQDIAEKRLKKPDANNAFSKLERVLKLDPQNAHALAAMEQIAEEYAKLADSALGNRHYIIADSYLTHARSASPGLEVISTIQSKLDSAKTSQSKHLASIQSLERSLMIEGLLESAAIDEKDGRLVSPEGDNALEKYQRVLQLDPNHTLAQSKLTEITL